MRTLCTALTGCEVWTWFKIVSSKYAFAFELFHPRLRPFFAEIVLVILVAQEPNKLAVALGLGALVIIIISRCEPYHVGTGSFEEIVELANCVVEVITCEGNAMFRYTLTRRFRRETGTLNLRVGLLISAPKYGYILALDIYVGKSVVKPGVPFRARSLRLGVRVPRRSADDERV